VSGNVLTKENFGKAFRKHRDAMKFTRDELGRLIGVSAKTIQSWEIGRTFPENIELFSKISSHLQIEIWDLLKEAASS